MKTEQDQITPEWLGIVERQVQALRYGVVQITVHESRVVQIEKTEKVRLERSKKGVSDAASASTSVAANPKTKQQ